MKYELAFSTLSTSAVDKSTRTSVPTSATRTTSRGSVMSNTTSTAQAYEWVKTGHWSLRQFREWFDALAKQEQVNPVAIFTGEYWIDDAHDRMLAEVVCYMPPNSGTPLYFHTQPKREPLTDEQIVSKAMHLSGLGTSPDVLQFARAIEAAHGIKE
jgi:hypothetical protein